MKIRGGIIIAGALGLLFAPAEAQTVNCTQLGTILSCDNGFTSQRLGQFDINSDGSMGQRLGGGQYVLTPPPDAKLRPDYPYVTPGLEPAPGPYNPKNWNRP